MYKATLNDVYIGRSSCHSYDNIETMQAFARSIIFKTWCPPQVYIHSPALSESNTLDGPTLATMEKPGELRTSQLDLNLTV